MTWYQRSKLVSKLFLSNLAPGPKQLSRSRWKMGFSRFVHQGTPNTVLLDAERRSSNTDNKRFCKVAVFSSVAAAATAICCYNIEFTPYKGRPHVVLVPRYLEKKLLESKIRKIKEEFKEDILPPEHPYTARVSLITKHLSEAPYLEPHGSWYKTQSIGSLFPEYLNWEVMVIDRPIVKVCCYDAKVVIFTGLLDRLESDAEIATVIGHEIGHDLVCFSCIITNYNPQHDPSPNSKIQRKTSSKGKMEAAVSAYAVNSKGWLGLGLGRQRVGFGSSKQTSSLSIGGVGCCIWSSRKRNIIMNCTRGTSMGMRPGPTIEGQSFDLNGRFVRDEAASALGGEDIVENGDVMLPQASIDFAIQYVLPACLGLGVVMFGFGYYLQTKITSAFVEVPILVGLISATKLLIELKELQHSCDRNRNSGGGSLTAMVPLTSVLKHVGLACLTVAVTMFGFGYILSYMSPGGITSAVLNGVVLFCVSTTCLFFWEDLSFPLGY